MHTQKLLLLFALTLLLDACGGKYVLSLPDSRSTGQESFIFMDARPVGERKWQVVANNPNNPLSQVQYIVQGDENFSPGRVDYLRKQLQTRAGDKLASRKLALQVFSVKEYPVETNAVGRAAAMAAVSYSAGIMMAPGREIGDVITVDIEIDIDGRIVTASVQRKYKSGKLEQAARSAIADAVDELVWKITGNSRG